MNKTININLAGNSFCIDDDAYQMLKDYLQSVEHNLSTDTDKKEVMDDIEARIAELFSDFQKKQQQSVVSEQMVKAVIEQMGKPDDFKDNGEQQSFLSKSTNYAKDLFHKHLYRDSDDRIIAGVCSGMGKWLGISAIWVRLLFVLFLFLWGFTALLYIILWLIVPEAKTAAQRLEMRGEVATVSKIEEEIRNQDDKKSERNGCASFLVTLFKICIWIAGGFVLFVAAVTLFGILMGLIGALTGLAAASPIGMFAVLYNHNTWLTIILIILMIITIGLPIFGLIYSLIKYFIKGERTSPRTIWVSFLIWLLALIGCIGIGAWQLATNPNIFDEISNFKLPLQWITEADDDNIKPSQLAVAPFNKVNIQGAAKVRLYQNQEQYIEATLRDNDDFEYHVTDSVLTIKTSKKGTKINIYTPQLQKMEFAGAAELKTNDKFKADKFMISASGASDIDMNIDANLLEISAEGASKIDLEGAADRLNIDVAGASKIDAEDMTARVCKITAIGASKAEINATDSLLAYPSGASRINYHGSPAVVSKAMSGGKVRKK